MLVCLGQTLHFITRTSRYRILLRQGKNLKDGSSRSRSGSSLESGRWIVEDSLMDRDTLIQPNIELILHGVENQWVPFTIPNACSTAAPHSLRDGANPAVLTLSPPNSETETIRWVERGQRDAKLPHTEAATSPRPLDARRW